MILLINTAAPEGFVALARGRAVVAQVTFHRQFGARDPLMPSIEAVFKKAKSTVASLRSVAVVTGPGSFAGLRTGISAANAIAWARDISVIGITTGAASSPETMLAAAVKKSGTKRVLPRYGRKPNISKKSVN